MRLKVGLKEKYKWFVWGILCISYVLAILHRMGMGVIRTDLVKSLNLSAMSFAGIRFRFLLRIYDNANTCRYAGGLLRRQENCGCGYGTGRNRLDTFWTFTNNLFAFFQADFW